MLDMGFENQTIEDGFQIEVPSAFIDVVVDLDYAAALCGRGTATEQALVTRFGALCNA